MKPKARAAPPHFVYHVLNRGVALVPLFQTKVDDEALERVMSQELEEKPTRLLALCLMPNHRHLVVWPKTECELTTVAQWRTHSTRCAGTRTIARSAAADLAEFRRLNPGHPAGITENGSVGQFGGAKSSSLRTGICPKNQGQ